MNLGDLVPWNRGGRQVPAANRGMSNDPFLALHREVNRLFEEAFRGFGMPSLGNGSPLWAAGWPTVEISETDKEIRVEAELPGLEEKDVEVLLERGELTLRGEKRAETQDRDRQFNERFYGRFERRIPLGVEVEEDKVTAGFKNGVLTVTLPKAAGAQAQVKRIAINGRH